MISWLRRDIMKDFGGKLEELAEERKRLIGRSQALQILEQKLVATPHAPLRI